ncbi:MAG: FAD-dependent oxidoreductase, partial [Anaerolineales bacterium]|nr:FAD-dependent oxidoreductase [Anaerolineales bacterium]
MRYVIIGAGVAGFAAVEAIRSIDQSSEIIMISDDPHGYYSRPGLAYYLTGEIHDKALYPRAKEDYKNLNFSFLKGRVTRILPSEHAVIVDGKHLTYSKLLVSVGARAVQLDVLGSKTEGVVKLDDLTDAKNIVKLAKSGKSVVVVGGGITALELTEGLLARGMRVHYLLRGDRYWSNVLDERESKAVEGHLQAEGVELHYHAELAEILEKKNRVAGVRLEDGQTIKCDMVAYAIGIRPCTELVQNIGMKLDRGILANEHLETSIPDIFAAGDVAQVCDPLTGHAALDSLWNPAREQGYVAGLNMAGR